jgi:hypothetical protein
MGFLYFELVDGLDNVQTAHPANVADYVMKVQVHFAPRPFAYAEFRWQPSRPD